jgi:hypothetical protein
MCDAKPDVRFTPNTDIRRDECDALFVPAADIDSARSPGDNPGFEER